MTDKRFKQLTKEGFTHAFIDTENLDISYICDNPNDCKNIVDLLNELNGYKEKVEKLLQSEFKKRTEEMEYWAKKEDWNTFRAIQVERGTIQLIAKELRVELE